MAADTDAPRGIRFPWGPLIALYSAITFFMLGIDMALLHLGYRHYHFMAVMPIVFCFVAAVVSFLTTFSAPLRRQAWICGILALLVGGVGTVIHLEIAFANVHGWGHLLEKLVFDPRPPLAPAALAGTGLLMIMVAVAERWPVPFFEMLMLAVFRRWPALGRWLGIKIETTRAEERVA